jgi:hypothetical protein
MQPVKTSCGNRISATLVALGVLVLVPTAHAQLVAVEADNGTLYTVSTADATLTSIGETGLPGIGALEYNPHDGFLYGLTTGADAALYRIGVAPSLDEVRSVDLVGELGVALFEGALAFGSDGTAYAVNGGTTTTAVLTLDLATGAASVLDFLDGRHDIGGLGWRGDGMLVGLDATNDQLIAVDPITLSLANVDELDPWPDMGSVGGMAFFEDSFYFATAGPLAVSEGSNSLYTFDPMNGDPVTIGSFDDTITGTGISGLAIVPEPATLCLLVLGGAGMLRRRRMA